MILYEDGERRIKAAEMDALRRSTRISKLDRKTNVYIRQKMDAQDTILDDMTFGMVMLREWTQRDYQIL
jgi:hypothetical protein